MANIRSQMKRNRQNERRRLRNKHGRSEAKTATRRALEAAETGDADAAATAMQQAQSAIDRAVAKGIINPRTAARRKSRLAAQLQRTLST